MRRIANNPSGKWLSMTDEQLARENAKFQRAVERQAEKDKAAAAKARLHTHKAWARDVHVRKDGTMWATCSSCSALMYDTARKGD